jgi:5,5'-dehydrodivanillate O-demethylase
MAITAEENERLTRVGRGTSAGEMLRRYWWPIASVSELGSSGTKAVKLLGEELTLYRDLGGRLGLIDEHCPHRGASMSYGIPLAHGLRCPYHGWCFDETGSCTEQPNEMRFSPRFREEGVTTAYSVQELGGLIFAYVGPEPRPVLPRYDVFAAERGPRTFVDVGAAVVPCNWLQIMENSVDPTHSEWLHGHYFDWLLEKEGQPKTTLAGRHVKLAFEEFEYGIIKRRLRAGQSEDEDDWQRGHPVVFPSILCVGDMHLQQFQVRVPMDDVTTWHVWYSVYTVSEQTAELLPTLQHRGEFFRVPVFDDDGRFLVDNIDGQDMMVWATQGPIADRTREHIGGSDRGVAMLRKMLREQIEAVERGEDPIGTIRDPGAGVIEFWVESKRLGAGYFPGNEMAGYLRTHSKFSPAMRELVALIDERAARRAPADATS